MQTLKLLISFELIFVFNTACPCTVSEIVSMVENKAGRQAILQACGVAVDDAPNCNTSRVIALAYADRDESDILDRCGLCENPICSTQFGQCLIDPRYGGETINHGPCSCVSAAGLIPGRVRCNPW